MKLHKTDRARAELKPGVRTLSQRDRTLLLMADGSKSVQDFRPLFDGNGEGIALRLLREGFLQVHPAPKPSSLAAPAPAPVPQRTAVAATRAPASTQTSPNATPVAITADQFEGKRSLATTRMFLFDICERMFARRGPDMADHFRGALRSARDREAMLAAAREMIEEIEKIAGHERADSISERIAMLLPVISTA